MNQTACALGLTAALLSARPALAAEPPLVMNIWPGETIGDFGEIGPERVRAPDEAPTPDATWITNVTTPTITVFRPSPETNTGVCVLIFPGGGYWNLAIDKEGEEVAARMNTYGITGVVVKYRVPRRPNQPEPLPAPLPLLDAQRAMSLVRSRAPEWGIDPDKIGVMGFSAGGHLALMAATWWDRRRYEPIDDIDRVSCRPDFCVPAYTGYILTRPNGDELADYIRFPDGTPPLFIVHADDDDERGAQPEQSQALYAAARRAGVTAELHIYATGGHGFGVRESGLPVSTWPDRFVEWLRWRRILPPLSADAAEAGKGGADAGRGADAGLPSLPQGNTGIAARYPADRGIAADPAVIFHDDFETANPADRWDMAYHRANIHLADQPQHVHAGARSLQFTVPRQRAEVSNELLKRIEPARDTVFLRYYSKFERGFDQVGSSHNGGLLAAIAPGLPYATPGVRADGRNKFMASLENWRGNERTPSPGELNVYCYHPEQRTDFGDHFHPSGKVTPFTYRPGDFGPHFAPRPDIIQDLGRWHCYELMLRANTPGHRDGRIACWLDGELVADFANLRLRDARTLRINHAAIQLHIGSNPTRPNRKWYDDIVIATSYIGPMTGAE